MLARAERKPRNERQAFALALLQHLFVRAIRDVVAILHRNDFREPLRAAQLARIDVRQPDVKDLPFLLQAHELAHRIFERHPWIGRMQLVQVDALQPEPAQAPFAGGTQVRRMRVAIPVIGSGRA